MSEEEWDEFIKMVKPLKRDSLNSSRLRKSIKDKFEDRKIDEELQKMDYELSYDQKLLEKNTKKRILQGKISINGKLDLHGCSVSESKKKVYEFINRNFGLQKRLVLIITGKGERLDVSEGWRGTGKLKQILPTWLNSQALSKKILWFDDAPANKGGNGAKIILLKKITE